MSIITVCPKGQLISECNEKIVRISAQKSKKWSNQNKDILLCQIAPTFKASANEYT